jgi:ABC-type multidrug transport system ATPase subunit
MIDFHNIKIGRESGEPLLSNISFYLQKGEKVVLTGESGVGKSTLLKLPLGGVEYLAGRVTVNSLVLSENSVVKIRDSVAYIPQEPRLPDIAVYEYLNLIKSFKHNCSSNFLDFRELLDIVKLPEQILSSVATNLSGGERQRDAIVSALMINRPILIADEITSALDRDSKRAVITHLKNSNLTILSSSHEKEWIESCRVVEITENGVIL